MRERIRRGQEAPDRPPLAPKSKAVLGVARTGVYQARAPSSQGAEVVSSRKGETPRGGGESTGLEECHHQMREDYEASAYFHLNQ